MVYEIEVAVDENFAAEINKEELRNAATATLRHQGIDTGALTVVISDDVAVQVLNHQYRGIDAPTDVLSFAAQEGEMPGDLPPELAEEMGHYWGDLIIAFPYTKAQAQHYNNAVDAELRLLVVHGVLHLLGYDHDTPERQNAMWDIQRSILESLGDTGTNWDREFEA